VWIVLGRRNEAGDIVGKIDVSVGYGRVFAPPPGAGYTREAVTLAGVPGEIVRSVNSDEVIVEYQWGEQVVMVRGNAADDEQMLYDMIQLANGLAVDEARAELTGTVPTGYEVLVTGPWQAEGDNAEPARIEFSNPPRTRFIAAVFEVDPPADFQYWWPGPTLATA
jgi:hypothetical protein